MSGQPTSGPDTPASGAGFFADRHIDARMRALLPTFARLAVVVITIGGLLGVHPLWRGLALAGDALFALAVTELVVRTGFVERARHGHVYTLLVLFAAQITLAEVVSRNITAYGMLHVIPITFAAVFFTQPAWRYSLPVFVAVLEYVAGRPDDLIDAGTAGVRLAALLLLAYLGAQLADVLREAMGAHRSLHSILEGAILELTPDELASRGAEVAQVDPGLGRRGGQHARAGGVPGQRGGGAQWRGRASTTSGRSSPGAPGTCSTGWPTPGRSRSRRATSSRSRRPRTPSVARGSVGTPGFRSATTARRSRCWSSSTRRPQGLDAQGRDRLQDVAEQLGLALGSSLAALQEQAGQRPAARAQPAQGRVPRHHLPRAAHAGDHDRAGRPYPHARRRPALTGREHGRTQGSGQPQPADA